MNSLGYSIDQKPTLTLKITEHVRCLIIGSGPGGYTAAIYLARADFKPVLYAGLEPGGQLIETTTVDNFPGYPDGVVGPQMMEDFRKQAERFGTDVRGGTVSSVDFSVQPYQIVIDEEKTVTADTVIVSTGATAQWLGLPSENQYSGFGVSACAVCDGFFFKKQVVAVVGGGDTAAEEATYLAKICSKVYLIVRKDKFKASKAMVDRISNTSNILVIFNSQISEVIGDGKDVTGVRLLNNKNNLETHLPVAGLFIAIGHKPNTEIFKGWLNLDAKGYLQTIAGSTRTNIAGVFACGDVQDRIYRQAVTAAGSGCMAAIDAQRFLANNESPTKQAKVRLKHSAR
jgi:thioredoxin reductase (NADPH)